MQFELKEKHLKLLQRTSITWGHAEFGAPQIDPKRPYGNSSIWEDMLRLLGLEELIGKLEEDDAASEAIHDWLWQLHKETETALKICLSTLAFEPGTYEEDGRGEWRKIR